MPSPASNRLAVACATLAALCTLGACGNRGELYLESAIDDDIEAEIRRLEAILPAEEGNPDDATTSDPDAAEPETIGSDTTEPDATDTEGNGGDGATPDATLYDESSAARDAAPRAGASTGSAVVDDETPARVVEKSDTVLENESAPAAERSDARHDPRAATPDEGGPERRLPERQLPERQLSERRLSGRRLSGRRLSGQRLPGQRRGSDDS